MIWFTQAVTASLVASRSHRKPKRNPHRKFVATNINHMTKNIYVLSMIAAGHSI